ncbi:MAG: hypothetical protein IPJ79_15670 [Bacteroidetes bacterium]|nr:hypothetical protein [Bacteroidota bacterium]
MNACVAYHTQAQAFFKFFGDSTQNQTLDGGIATDDGGYILYGGYYVPAAGGKLASFLKTDAAGNLLWKKHLSFVNMEPRHIKSVVELPSHELMLFTQYQNNFNYEGYLVIKTDSAGNVLWSKNYSFSNFISRQVYRALLSNDGNILLGTTTGSVSSIYGEQTIYKLDTAGNIIWNNAFRSNGNGDDYLTAMAENSNSDIFIIGTRSAVVGGQSRPVLSKMDASGNVLWSKVFTDQMQVDDPVFSDILMLPSGNIAVSGWANEIPVVPTYPFVLEFDTAGTIVKTMKFKNSTYSLSANSLAIDSAYNISLYGMMFTGNYNLWYMKCDSAGTVQYAHYLPFNAANYLNINPGHNGSVMFTTSGNFNHYTWVALKRDPATPFCQKTR